MLNYCVEHFPNVITPTDKKIRTLFFENPCVTVFSLTFRDYGKIRENTVKYGVSKKIKYVVLPIWSYNVSTMFNT